MDKIIVNKKLDSLYRCINRIQEKCPADAAELKINVDLQDVIVLNLSRAVQLCVDNSGTYTCRIKPTNPKHYGRSISAFGRDADN